MSVLVPEYDLAIAHYCGDLGFDLIEDSDLGSGKRWVLVAPPGSSETRLLLARASGPEQTARIGDQTGGRVFLVLFTDDFDRDYAAYAAAGVEFREAPRVEPYGKVCVFRDRFGNLWDLLEPANP
ncbi:glyoxalase/Bleomycin resistance protein/Dioxygenase superfamily protein [Asticcacaulis biprosthecium C19]|uniref:Glyoxalase/Bleomycin resistance protein/Dioxygenase superfamily protein n=1 Tax=Asticcacaulis biprosthecium C19 TaxID=715226 RepID=F4QPT7_9CAUL|nr:glyoxalase/Bleomycin resistance protein/Dioxygenase superfamily protein [Asticcacaulis biprosthecium C19]